MSKVVGIGSALFDIIMYSDKFPSEDTKLRAEESITQGGGPCSTALVALSVLGIESEYIGNVGDDQYGKAIVDDFKKYGVNCSRVKIDKGKQSANSFVLCNTAKGSRTCVYSLGTLSEPNYEESELEDILSSASVLHLDGYHHDLAMRAAKIVHKNGGIVSLDAGTIRDQIEDFLNVSDWIIASEEFALKITKKENAEDACHELAKKYDSSITAVTCGKRGGVFKSKDMSGSYPIYDVEVVDSNGAGDVFHGAFIAAILNGFDLKKSCCFASGVSSLKCEKKGARAGVPTFEEACVFLRSQGLVI